MHNYNYHLERLNTEVVPCKCTYMYSSTCICYDYKYLHVHVHVHVEYMHVLYGVCCNTFRTILLCENTYFTNELYVHVHVHVL